MVVVEEVVLVQLEQLAHLLVVETVVMALLQPFQEVQ
jgi:hypothetical protein